MKNLRHLIQLVLVVLPCLLIGQTADIQKGCIPLKVQFQGGSQNNFWEFGDGASSTDATPSHIYTNPGNYQAMLYTDASKSDLIGVVDIFVYQDVKVNITSDLNFSCTDIPVAFQSQITLSNEVTVTDYLWTFGDGATATDVAPSYQYSDLGVYDVSLEVKTDFPDCDKTIVVEDMVEIFDHRAIFRLDNPVACSVPAVFSIQNNSIQDSRLNYDWTIGSVALSGYNPGSFTLTETGETDIKLTISSDFGCTSEYSVTARILDNQVDVNVPTLVCDKMPIQMKS